MRAAWTSFAEDGDPGWPAYDTDQRSTMRFDTPLEVVSYPEEPSRQIWQDHAFTVSMAISLSPLVASESPHLA